MLGLYLRAKNFLQEKKDEGASMGEYALLLALIAVALLTAVTAFKDQIVNVFNNTVNVLK